MRTVVLGDGGQDICLLSWNSPGGLCRHLFHSNRRNFQPMPPSGGNEYRILIRDRVGRVIQRHIVAASAREARKRAKAFLVFHEGRIQSIRQKRRYVYRVKRSGKTIEGSQTAYARAEVVTALQRLGFEVKSVRRNYSFMQSAPATEIVSFVSQSAKLLEQKLPFHEVLHLMANNTREKNLRAALREIINDLRNGTDSREAFLRQAPVLGYHTSLLLGIATKSGDMRSIFESVARLVERQADFKKGLLSSLMLPGITAVTLVIAIGFYVLYLLPKMMDLLGPMIEEVPPMTAWTLEMSAVVGANLYFIGGAIFASLVAFYFWVSSPEGKVQYHRFIIRVPYFGGILRNTSVEIFCRVLGIMYTSSGENIDVIQIAADASGNSYFSKQVRTVAVPMMLKYGSELGRALDATKFFPEMVVSRFRTGAETGSVKATAVQLADYYQMENGYAMKNLTNVIEMIVTVMITLSLVFLTYLSSETASIRIQGM
jgi:type IV pilus assembly protein PilC